MALLPGGVPGELLRFWLLDVMAVLAMEEELLLLMTVCPSDVLKIATGRARVGGGGGGGNIPGL